MGRRGPLPKPTKQKELEGNPGHRPLPTNEPEPRLAAKAPAPPSWLPVRAKEAWRLVVKELHAAEMLATLDTPILEQYCMAYAQWRDMVVAVKKNGYTQRFYDSDGNEKYAQVTPEATLVSKFAADCNRWAKVLGLGPAYRVGLSIGGPDPGEERDEIAEALQGGGSADINPPPKKRAAKKKATKRKPTKKQPAKKRPAKKRPAKKAR